MGLLTELAARLKGDAATRHNKATEEYRALLLREQSPRPGDDEKLVAVMAELGRGPDDLAGDAALVREIDAAERLAAEEQARDETRKAANVAYNKAKDQADADLARVRAAAEAKLTAARNTWAAACENYNAAVRARNSLGDLHLRFESALTGQRFDVLRDARDDARRAAGAAHVARCGSGPSRHELLVTLAERFIRQAQRPTSGVSIHTRVDDELGAAGQPPLTDEEAARYFGRLLPERFEFRSGAPVLPDDEKPLDL